MLKSLLLSLAIVGGITALTTTNEYGYDAPTGCDTSRSYQSCIQPLTSVETQCLQTCTCSAEDLNRKCLLKYCPGLTYTHTLWMDDCTSLGYSYIASNGDYITGPATVTASATKSKATETSEATETSDSSSATAAASTAASSASSQASAGAGSPTSGTSPTSTSAANASTSAQPNVAGHAMGLPTGGVLVLLATAAGTLAGMLLL